MRTKQDDWGYNMFGPQVHGNYGIRWWLLCLVYVITELGQEV